jgi:hypothetical protein
MRVLRDLAPSKLHEAERDLIRTTADTLVFCRDPDDPAGGLALVEVDTLFHELAESGRWTSERAQGLRDDVRACGPASAAPLPAAA